MGELKMKISNKSFLIALLLLVSAVVAACSGGDSSGSPSNEKGNDSGGADQEVAQVLNFTAADTIPSMDSAKATDRLAAQYLNDTTEGLYRLGKDGEYETGIATGQDISDDG